MWDWIMSIDPHWFSTVLMVGMLKVSLYGITMIAMVTIKIKRVFRTRTVIFMI
jgi:hypothetical protein